MPRTRRRRAEPSRLVELVTAAETTPLTAAQGQLLRDEIAAGESARHSNAGQQAALREARVELAAQRERAEQAEAVRDALTAELARLHEGEEPPGDPTLWPTAAQWIWIWNRSTAAERLHRAEGNLRSHKAADACLFGGHAEQLAELPELRQRPTAWAYDQTAKALWHHRERAEQLAAALSNVLGTFDRLSTVGGATVAWTAHPIDPDVFQCWRAALDRCSREQPAVVHADTEQQASGSQSEIEYDRDRFKADYLGACQTIAAMHAAAVGGVQGPKRGVVEDVEDLRAERDQLAEKIAFFTAARLDDLDQIIRLSDERDRLGAAPREERDRHHAVECLGWGSSEPGGYGYLPSVCAACGKPNEYGELHPYEPFKRLSGALGAVGRDSTEPVPESSIAAARQAGQHTAEAAHPDASPQAVPDFGWHVLSECSDEARCPIHGRNAEAVPEPSRPVDWSGHQPADRPPLDATLATVAAALQGLHQLITSSSRDWADHGVDAWIYAVLVGWECEEPHAKHDDVCGGDAALSEVGAKCGWAPESIAKARAYRAAFRALERRSPAAPLPRRHRLHPSLIRNLIDGARAQHTDLNVQVTTAPEAGEQQ